MRNALRPLAAKLDGFAARASVPLALLASLLTAFVFTLALPFVGGSGVAYAIGATVGTVANDTYVDGDTPDAFRQPSVSDMLLRVNPSDFPVTQLLQAMGAEEEVKQIKHSWFEIGRLPRSVTVNGAQTAGSANTAKTVPVDSRNAIKPGDILFSATNATDTSFMYYVTAINSDTSIDVKVLPQDTTGTAPRTAVNYGTVPALADNEVLYWIGNAKTEKDAASQAIAMSPAERWNYVQTIDHKVEISDHAMRFATFAVQNWPRALQEAAYEFRKSREANIVFSTEASVVNATRLNGSGTYQLHKMKGLYGFVSQSVSLPTAATESDLIELGYDVFAASGKNNGSSMSTRRKLLVGGSDVMKAIDKSGVAKLQTTRTETIAGVTLMEIDTRVGKLATAYHPLFDEFGKSDEALVLDPSCLKRGVLQEVDQRKLDLKNSSEGIDAEGEYLIVKETLLCMNADNGAHFRLTLS